jgi:uncharacterized Zn finger protein
MPHTLRTDEPGQTWESLTWADIEAWSDRRSVERGRTYQRQGRVHQLARSADGRLVATVVGGDRYAVTVSLDMQKKNRDRIRSTCTCPLMCNGCKHAVAVVAEYLDCLGRGNAVPIADADDPRWNQINNAYDDETDQDEDDADENIDDVPARRKSAKGVGENWEEKIKQHIDAKSREELGEMLMSLMDRFPELRDELREKISLGEGDANRLLAQARKELVHVTSQEAWRNHWDGEGSLPDYSKLLGRLERLVELGQVDAVARLAPELVNRGMEQVGRAHDEGETGMELNGCLAVVFKAVAKSTLPPSQKLILAIDAALHDDYGVMDGAIDVVLDAQYQPADWSEVADELERRLNTNTSVHRKSDKDEELNANDFSRNYQRDHLSGWLIQALTNADRTDELLDVYEQEAQATGSYERLVAFLIEQKQYDDACRWAEEGIEKAANKLPGIAANLAKQLCEVAKLRKQWDIVAAHAAQTFFDRPAVKGFDELMTAAQSAGCLESVQRLAQAFLETGIPPVRLSPQKKGLRKLQITDGWPLPVPDYLTPLLRSEDQRHYPYKPHHDVLIDLAIARKRPDDVLHWYDTSCALQKPTPYGWATSSAYADRVAEAVAQSHPERAIDIYRRQVDQNLQDASISAYETVASYLRKMKPILKSLKCEHEWTQLVADIRLRYRNRPRFMEILDQLENRPILKARIIRK